MASCPCSIVISIPLAYFSCIGAISKKGLLIKGTKHIEDLAKAQVLALDKTGTITTGKMKVQEFVLIKNSKATENNEIQSKSEKITNKEENLKKEFKKNENAYKRQVSINKSKNLLDKTLNVFKTTVIYVTAPIWMTALALYMAIGSTMDEGL